MSRIFYCILFSFLKNIFCASPCLLDSDIEIKVRYEWGHNGLLKVCLSYYHWKWYLVYVQLNWINWGFCSRLDHFMFTSCSTGFTTENSFHLMQNCFLSECLCYISKNVFFSGISWRIQLSKFLKDLNDSFPTSTSFFPLSTDN